MVTPWGTLPPCHGLWGTLRTGDDIDSMEHILEFMKEQGVTAVRIINGFS